MPENRPSDTCHGHAGQHAAGIHAHRHGDTPHPPQSPDWSALRMTVAGRLAAALTISLALWAFVLTVLHS